MAINKTTRLQKYLAQCGISSRRKAELLIAEGRVKVDGRVVVEPGTKIDPERQQVRFDDTTVLPEKKKVYLLLNKPQGYVTTVSDPQGRPKVTDLIKDVDERVFPVGRLDLDSQGALILTNDGELAQKIQHPSFEVTKTYETHVSGFPNQKKLKSLADGILLEGRMTSPAHISVLKKFKGSTLIRITIHEGRKRQVRKMFAAIDHPVITLRRIAYGQLYLRKLQEGSYRSLTPKDLDRIFKNIPLQKEK